MKGTRPVLKKNKTKKTPHTTHNFEGLKSDRLTWSTEAGFKARQSRSGPAL